jgi:hypothetical protein
MAKSKTPDTKKARQLGAIFQIGLSKEYRKHKTGYARIMDEENNFEISIDTQKVVNGKFAPRKNSKITVVFPNGTTWTGTILDLRLKLA